jgi:MFS family permease
MVLIGVGAGLAFPSLMTIAMSSATPEDAGIASGLVNTTQQVGGALGLAVLATLSSTHSGNLLANGDSPASALTSGYHLAFTIGAVLVTIAVGLAVFGLRPGPAASHEVAVDEPAFLDGEPAYIEEAA